jgi:hypothetical protein
MRFLSFVHKLKVSWKYCIDIHYYATVSPNSLAATNTQATIEEQPFLCSGNVNTPL